MLPIHPFPISHPDAYPGALRNLTGSTEVQPSAQCTAIRQRVASEPRGAVQLLINLLSCPEAPAAGEAALPAAEGNGSSAAAAAAGKERGSVLAVTAGFSTAEIKENAAATLGNLAESAGATVTHTMIALYTTFFPALVKLLRPAPLSTPELQEQVGSSPNCQSLHADILH